MTECGFQTLSHVHPLIHPPGREVVISHPQRGAIKAALKAHSFQAAELTPRSTSGHCKRAAGAAVLGTGQDWVSSPFLGRPWAQGHLNGAPTPTSSLHVITSDRLSNHSAITTFPFRRIQVECFQN